ncbi:hypothetical protein EYC84_004428 [Monilinia fructicola]|uniref:J domain-containing protein n=1 Tax=Monilinia fructicola TaxID=38448 RepID=A0A5M9K2V3_MONFR|nr:hypothetical protein EYC84_004428 [Monilinia fructicola]
MAPVSVTEDYYMVLEVVQTATTAQVVQSYRRLALKIHPDRNTSPNATEAFQLLGRAYETLKDEGKRRAYDIIYPSITRSRPSPEATRTPRSQKSDEYSEATQIAALQKSKRERRKRWETTKNTFDYSISKLQADIRRLEQEIKNLNSIAAADAAKKAQENSWGSWFLSPIYKKVQETEEEKERNDRERQERRIEKDMKERRLELAITDLKNKEGLLRKAKEDVDAANLVDDRKIADIEHKIWLKETRERQEKERLERERMARERQEKERLERERMARERQEKERLERERQEKERLERERKAREWQEWLKAEKEIIAKIQKEEQQRREKREREAAEARKKQEEEKKWQKLMDEEVKKYQERYSSPDIFSTAKASTHQTSTPNCRHDGWWPKVQGQWDVLVRGQSEDLPQGEELLQGQDLLARIERTTTTTKELFMINGRSCIFSGVEGSIKGEVHNI